MTKPPEMGQSEDNTEVWPPPPNTSEPQPQVPQKVGGALILALGIISIVILPLLGPVAWIMGSKALKKIKAGQGELDKRGVVVAGLVCGIIGTVIMVCNIVLFGVLYYQGAFNASGPVQKAVTPAPPPKPIPMSPKPKHH